MRRATVPVVLTVAALALAACGGGSSGGSGLPTVGASPTGSAPATTTAPTSSAPAASATPATDPSPWTALPTIPNGPNKGLNNGSVLASSVARTPQDQAAVAAYVAYWKFVAKAGYETKVDKAALAKVAALSAATNIERYAKALRTKGNRTIGWTAIHVTKIENGAGGQLLQACLDNASFDVRASSGKPVEKPVPAFDATGGVQTVKGRLVVTFSSTENRTTRCPGGNG